MKTYIFKVELEEEEGIWQVVIPATGLQCLGKYARESLKRYSRKY